MLEIVDALLNGEVDGLSPLMHYNTLFEIRASHQQFARHSDLRPERLSRMFTRILPSVGPDGLEVIFSVSDDGKTNVNGRLETDAVMPHRNPILGADFCKAAMMLYRWNVMDEAFPNLTDPESYFWIPMLRAEESDKTVALQKATDNHHALYRYLKIFIMKVTHHGRGQGQRDADAAMGSDGRYEIERMAKYRRDDQHMSYMLSCALGGMATVSGWDYKDLSSIDSPSWIDPEEYVDAETGESLVELLLPPFAEQRRAVEAAWQAAESKDEAEEQKLFTALGVVNWTRYLCVIFLQAAASGARDDKNNLVADTTRNHRKYHATNKLFRHKVFATDAFAAFAADVKAREEEERSGSKCVTTPP